MQKARQLRHVLRIVGQFGEMSGLHIQPAKSVLISLNTGISTPAQMLGIPILQRGEFTRYLGYQVGTTEAQNNQEDTAETGNSMSGGNFGRRQSGNTKRDRITCSTIHVGGISNTYLGRKTVVAATEKFYLAK
ncbi:RxLR effector candidate protein [Phytophthora palmivora]|uniref:RxLR effector candidate protein n=1 Tax=Phytophthora palmivora TaxID=4796 RepID=A0A2P4Y3R3_9STRA|nr:RxLR effector candidate protein [Phytophthora palmivora]